MSQPNLQIAIDGHSSTGKSTLARGVAKRLNITYVDSGAMYRAVTLYAIREGLSDSELIDRLDELNIDFDQDNKIRLNGEVVEHAIRSLEVADRVSAVAQLPQVRRRLVHLQQSFEGSVVMDGRDIGTVVFPKARLKIFMTARPEVRAKRRFDELIAKGEQVSLESVKENLLHRDFQDENRLTDPLRPADDAIFLDNSDLSQSEQLEWVLMQLGQ